MSKYPLLGMTLAELQSVVNALGMPGLPQSRLHHGFMIRR